MLSIGVHVEQQELSHAVIWTVIRYNCFEKLYAVSIKAKHMQTPLPNYSLRYIPT